ncbi:MAG: DNA-processing protein DprA [candidate division Zixibacteria bacterium]
MLMLDLKKYSPASQILALKMTGKVGPRTFALLINQYQTVEDIFLAEVDELQQLEGIGPGRASAVAKAPEFLDPAQIIIESLDAFDSRSVIYSADNYPRLLDELNDPPPLLYYQGNLPSQDEKTVAIIGSQDVSAEGIGDAVELGSLLAKNGVSIVGGLARGIDTAGHVGALKERGKTYAVLPCGINIIHPLENSGLAKEITESGGLISEYIPDSPVSTGRLMSRNRIIVGLSQVVVIGQVSANSVGTLDAALCCHQLGKLLFVIVGDENPHLEKFIEYGAIPLTNVNEYKLILKSLV